MYIVESNERNSNFGEVYEFTGDSEEVRQFKINMGSLVLAAIRTGDMHHRIGINLIRWLNIGDKVTSDFRPEFEATIANFEELKYQRLKDLVSAGIEGLVTSRAIFEEQDALLEFDPQGSQGITWVNKEGLMADGPVSPHNHIFAPFLETNIADVVGDDGIEFDLASRLGLNATCYQLELTYSSSGRPHVASELEHTSLGVLKDDGSYEAVVTVLHHDHPIVQKVNANK